MLSTSQSLDLITKDLTRALDATASKSLVKRETRYYLDNIGKVKSADSLVADRRLFAYAMKAFGLDDMVYAKALVKKALVEGVDKQDSLANRLVDPRLREFVAAFNFARRGSDTTAAAETQEGTVDRYLRQVLEEDAGQTNEGVRLALYFQRKASTISSAYSILADKALTEVARTVLDLPASSSTQDVDKLAALISKRMPVSDLKDTKKLGELLKRFAIKWDLANSSSQTVSPLLATDTTRGMNSSVLAAIQKLKIGGA